MKIRSLALAVALLAPAPLLAQQDQPRPDRPERPRMEGRREGMHGRMHGMRRPRGNPLQGLLERREQLNLTADQVRRLEAIQQRLESQVRPLRERMTALHEQVVPGLRERRGEPGECGGERPRLTPEQRQALERAREQVRPLAQQLREAHRNAVREAMDVLTDAQKQQLRELRREHGRRGEPGRRFRRERGERERIERGVRPQS
jgi:hypothetical protein